MNPKDKQNSGDEPNPEDIIFKLSMDIELYKETINNLNGTIYMLRNINNDLWIAKNRLESKATLVSKFLVKYGFSDLDLMEFENENKMGE